MTTVNLTDAEKDGLEELFELLCNQLEEETLFTKFKNFIKSFIRNYL